MKLTGKFVLLLALLLLIHTVSLVAYYRTSVASQLVSDIREIKEQSTEQSNEYMKRIEQLVTDRTQLESYLNQISNERRAAFTISDLEGRELMHTDKNYGGIWQFETENVAFVNGRAAYIVDIKTPMKFTEVLSHINSVERLLYFDLISIVVVLLILMAYFRYDVVKPLYTLHQAIEKVNFRNFFVSLSYRRKDEIGSLFRKFEEMGSRLDSAKKEQFEMVSAISHDIKTPLTSILGYMQRLSAGKIHSDEKRQEYYEIIYRKAKDIENLIQDFSAYTKSEEAALQLKVKPVSAMEFLQSILVEYSEELQTREAVLTTKISIPSSTMLLMDSSQLRRVFANLISNALRYVEPPVHIELSCKILEELAVFALEDNGPGVPEEERKDIFNKFYRAEKSR